MNGTGSLLRLREPRETFTAEDAELRRGGRSVPPRSSASSAVNPHDRRHSGFERAFQLVALALSTIVSVGASAGDESPVTLDPVPVEGQPLGANVLRLLEAIEFLGSPPPVKTADALREAAGAGDARRIQEILDAHVLLAVDLGFDGKTRTSRGPAPAAIQQAGFTPAVVKVLNPGGLTVPLRPVSPQAGPVYSGTAELTMRRMEQLPLLDNQNTGRDPGRFLALELHTMPPMASALYGLEVEYALLLIHSSEAGLREARIAFKPGDGDTGSGKGSLEPRSEALVRFDARPAVSVALRILEADGTPTAARFVFQSPSGRVYPPQPKRLAPDLFFQRQIYRRDGDRVLLPPGEIRVEWSRGPEYRTLQRAATIPSQGTASLEFRTERWIDPAAHGFYSGDHHIHAAGCAHYTSPTEGVRPEDMFLQVKGEGLNVGCVLTWGPCFDFQRRFFSPKVDGLSDPFTLLKYDLEISGFGSQALGHVCLLGLHDQVYPGSEGTKGWPTWTTPVLRWAKAQGGFTGYAHSASGLAIDPPSATRRIIEKLDGNQDGRLSPTEAERGLLPEGFSATDGDGDGALSEPELVASHERAAERLPNFAVPEMNGVGAMELPVSAALGACDFISAMNTPRIQEWNTWYHVLDCGIPLKVSGETDFPCMSGTRVGQGRVYVRLGKIERLDFRAWCEGLARGRSYVSDGFAHAAEFAVEGRRPGGEPVRIEGAQAVRVKAAVAFSPETPLNAAHGGVVPPGGKRHSGDTVLLHGTLRDAPHASERFQKGNRLVEVVVNGHPAATREVPADGQIHSLDFDVKIDRSSWVALRQFPQLHTNPVEVRVAGKPIRASRRSALWCIEAIELLWKNREKMIAAEEREEARKAFQEAIAIYRRIAEEAEARS